MNKLTYTYYYFIGAGGIGMSALARYFNKNGGIVLGYDKTPTNLTAELIKEGIDLHFEDNIEAIPTEATPAKTLVIFTPAVPKEHEELNHFINQGYTVLKRSQVLGDLTKDTFCIGIAGTHGKTTTTALLGHILFYAGLESTAFCGGILENHQSNLIGHGTKITIVEADEYDRSFLQLSPNKAIITSIDADHLDIYENAEDLLLSFQEYALKVTPDNLYVNAGLPFEGANTYGINESSDYQARNIRIVDDYFVFDIVHQEESTQNIQMHLLGRHNIENATAAFAVAKSLGLSGEIIKSAIGDFKGIKRRFTRNKIKQKIYIDDYAHHPTELNACLSAVKELYPNKKTLVVFQPHLFSRTQDFVDDFARSLAQVSELILLDIYPAREKPIEGVTSEWLLAKIDLKNKEVCSLEKAMELIKEKEFDVIVTVGAGNIDTLYQPIKNWLNED